MFPKLCVIFLLVAVPLCNAAIIRKAVRKNVDKATPGSVLYLVKATNGPPCQRCPLVGKYERLHAVMQTWGKTMVNRPMLILGPEASDEFPFPVHTATKKCEGTVGRIPGLPCRIADGLA